MSILQRINPDHEAIALEGAVLIDNFFLGGDSNVLRWSPLHPKLSHVENTSLIYGDLRFDEIGQAGSFRSIVRQCLQKAGIAELSYIKYDRGWGDPIWVMLVENNSTFDLQVGTHVCHRASHSWTIRQLLRRSNYGKRRLDAVLKLLVPNYPDCDRNCPLSQHILSAFSESGAGRQSASQRSSRVGGCCDE